jgi:two-component system sensor histidine kinase DegS
MLKKEGSFGLRGMKERVELLDGSISIQSSKGNGTKVIIKIPLK